MRSRLKSSLFFVYRISYLILGHQLELVLLDLNSSELTALLTTDDSLPVGRTHSVDLPL